MKRSNLTACALLRNGLHSSLIEDDHQLDSFGHLEENEHPQTDLPIHHYDRLCELGRGGMGTVYEVWDQIVRRPLAMKVLHELREGSPDDESSQPVARFLNEAQITGQIDHPGVAPVHQIGIDDNGCVFFTMQVVKGKSLQEILSLPHSDRLEGNWSTTRLINILLRVCETLAYAHSKNIIHRDLKPDNIMVGQFGETYVMDWGLAKRINPEVDLSLSRSPLEQDDILPNINSKTEFGTVEGSVMGTPTYMSPEQAQGKVGDLGQESDIYSVGAILYYVLAGFPPYTDKGLTTAREIVLAVSTSTPTALNTVGSLNSSPELAAICEKAMCKNQQHRYKNMLEMGDDLRAYLENRVVKAYHTGALAELKKWVKRNRGIAISSLLALFIAVVGLGGIFLIQERRKRDLDASNERVLQEQEQTKLALKNEKEAHNRSRSIGLATESSRILEADPGSALLVAVEAAKITPTTEANNAILQALDSSREIHTLDGYGEAFAINRDETKIASSNEKHQIVVIDAANRQNLATLKGHTGEVYQITFNLEGDLIASASSDGKCGIWNAQTGNLIAWLKKPNSERTHEGSCYCAEFSQNGNLLVTAGEDGYVRLWDPKTQASISHCQEDFPVRTIHVSRDSRFILFGSLDGSAHIWNIPGGTKTQLRTGDTEGAFHRGGISHVEISRDQKYLLTVAAKHSKDSTGRIEESSENLCFLWHSNGNLIKRLPHPKRTVVTSAVFSSIENHLITGASDGYVRLWDLASEVPRLEIPASNQRISAVDISKDGQLIAAAGEDGMATIWHRTTGNLVMSLKGHKAPIQAIQFTPDGHRVLTRSEDKTLRVWRVHKRNAFPLLKTNTSDIKPAINPMKSDEVLFASKRENAVAVWDAFREVEKFQLEIAKVHRTNPVQTAIYSSNGDSIVTTSEDGKVGQWCATTGKLTRKFEMPFHIRKSVETSSDSRSLNIQSREKNIAVLLNLQDGSEQYLTAEKNGEFLFLFSPDGRRVLEKRNAIQNSQINASTREGLQYVVREFDHPFPIHVSPYHFDGGGGGADFLKSGSLVSWAGKIQTQNQKNQDHHSLHIFALDSQKQIFCTGHREQITSLKISQNSPMFLTGSDDGFAILWNIKDGSVKWKSPNQNATVLALGISADGSRLLTSTSDAKAPTLWNYSSGDRFILARNEQQVRSQQFSPSGQYVMTTSSEDSRIAIWTAKDGKLFALLPGKVGEDVQEVSFSPDESWILALYSSGITRMWPTDIMGFAQQHTPRHLGAAERELFRITTSDSEDRHSQTTVKTRPPS